MIEGTDDPVYWISRALLDDPRTSRYAIDVVNNQGTITLTGMVPSQDVSQAAEEVARRQKGVVILINELKVEKS